MPDGVKYIFNEIIRKLSLAKIASTHKGKELIDDVLFNDLPKLKELLDGKSNDRQII